MTEKHVAFSVSGGCFFYQMGIAYFMQQHFDMTDVKFSGASGGCWPATLLAAGIDVKKALEVVLKFAPRCVEARAWKALGAYGVYDKGIAIAFEELCREQGEGEGGQDNLPARVNGRLAIAVTRLAWSEVGLFGLSRPYFKDEVVSEFHSNEDIVQCIVASALIPFALNGKPFVRYRDWICADGGITNVSGVRRFAAELVHDIELMEEGLEGLLEEGLEQAHRLSQSYSAAAHPPPPLNNNNTSTGSEQEAGSNIDTDMNTTEGKGGQQQQHYHALHGHVPESTGPYGVAYIPLDVAKKISSSLLHVCSAVVSSGVTAVTDRVTAVTDRVTAVRTASQETVASCTAPALALLIRLTSTSATATATASPPSSLEDGCRRDSNRSPASDHIADYDGDVDVGDVAENVGLHNYPSWPVPGLSAQRSSHDDDDGGGGGDIESSPLSASSSTQPSSSNSNSTCCSTVESSQSSPSSPPSSPSSSMPPPLSSPKRQSEDGVVRGDSTYWRVQGPLVSRIPLRGGGGLQLEVSPWMWRHQPVLNYHLSSDPESCRRLFEMGMVDAAEHYFDLMKFFSPDEYVLLMK